MVGLSGYISIDWKRRTLCTLSARLRVVDACAFILSSFAYLTAKGWLCSALRNMARAVEREGVGGGENEKVADLMSRGAPLSCEIYKRRLRYFKLRSPSFRCSIFKTILCTTIHLCTPENRALRSKTEPLTLVSNCQARVAPSVLANPLLNAYTSARPPTAGGSFSHGLGQDTNATTRYLALPRPRLSTSD